MEGIEKLHELAADINGTEIIAHIDVGSRFVIHTEWLDSWHKAFDAACDEVEREIAERYMELPVDADGVPVRVGDTVQFVNDAGGTGAKVEVCAVSNHYAYYGEGRHFYRAKNCRHVKPRTLEDVLDEFASAYDRIGGEDDEHFKYLEIVKRYADEIRELMEVDA